MVFYTKVFFLVTCCLYSRLAITQIMSGDPKPVVKIGKFVDAGCNDQTSRASENLVLLSFFNFLQDTISLYIENRLVFKAAVSKDTSIVSTDYTGFSFAVSLPHAKTDIYIMSNKERVLVKARLKRKYPVYLIQLYNNVWYINPRKCFPALK